VTGQQPSPAPRGAPAGQGHRDGAGRGALAACAGQPRLEL